LARRAAIALARALFSASVSRFHRLILARRTE
jgi:hypothetical protein